MWWMLAAPTGWASGVLVPPPARLEGASLGLGLETTVLNGPPFGGRLDLNAFRRGWTYGLSGTAGLDPAPNAWFVNTVALDVFVGGQLGLGRSGRGTAMLTPYMGITAHRWLAQGITSWGPMAGAAVNFWDRSQVKRPNFEAAGLRLGGEIRMLPLAESGAMVFLPQPSLTVGLGALFAHRSR